MRGDGLRPFMSLPPSPIFLSQGDCLPDSDLIAAEGLPDLPVLVELESCDTFC